MNRKIFVYLLFSVLLIFPTTNSLASVKFLPGVDTLNDIYAPGLGNGGYDVQNYEISLAFTIDSSGKARIKASNKITAKATQNLSKFSLDLNKLTVNKVLLDNKVSKFNSSDSKVYVTANKGILKNKIFTVIISYEGYPSSYLGEGETEPSQSWLKSKTGILAVGEPFVASYWFPVNDHPSDKATYKFYITTPESLTAISNGNLISDPVAVNGLKTWIWVEKYPMAPYNTTLAIGDYTLIKNQTPSGLPVISAFENSASNEQKLIIRKAVDLIAPSIEIYENRFGKYPFETAGAIFSDISLNFAMETQERPTYSISNLVNYGDNLSAVITHELAHQWYAASVTPSRWTDIWLNEGFATYAQWIWSEDKKLESAQSPFDFWYNATADNIPHKKTITGEAAYKALWNVKVGEPPVPSMFGKAVYNRGAMTLHVLRSTIGDSSFYELLRDWAKLKSNSNGSISEFIKLAQSKSKVDLTKLFNDWLYTDTKPTITNYATK